MPNTNAPDSAVVYILDDIPGEGEFQGTGVIIGPHTILTAAHVVYDADTGASADAISLYPGYTPGATNYNPTGALGGVQSIHFVKVADNNDALSPAATQSDFAIIDTSADLTPYGSFALDPSFTSGDVVVKGYPASDSGNLSGSEAVVSRDGRLSDLATAGLPLSPGYSGGPLYDTVERNGRVLDAVVGLVSTNEDATKLTKAKVDLIRHWIHADQSLYAGGQDAPTGLIPQIAGTVSGSVDAAPVAAAPGNAALAATIPAAFTYSDLAASHGRSEHRHVETAVPHQFAALVSALQGHSAGDAAFAPAATDTVMGLAAPAHAAHGRHRITGGA